MPTVLDLFCGIGGAAWGYHQAGFEVIGVDIDPQPDYPFMFLQANALDPLNWVDLAGIDFIHASPPCQAYTATTGNMPNARTDLPALIEPTRRLLKLSDKPYVIENVVGAPLLDPAKLCGSMFGLGVDYSGPSAPPGWYELRRHRLFETNWGLTTPSCAGNHKKPVIGIYGNHPAYNRRKYGVGKGQFSRREKEVLAQQALRIDWSNSWDSLKEAIPPAYTEYIGMQFLRQGSVDQVSSDSDRQPREQ